MANDFPEATARWSKEFPKISGIYWARWPSTVSQNTFVVEVIGNRFYMIGRAMIYPNVEVPVPDEWLGPIMPTAVNSYYALRAAAVAAEAWIVVQAETWTCQHADQPMRCSRCSLRIKAKELVNQLRAALHPQPEEGK